MAGSPGSPAPHQGRDRERRAHRAGLPAFRHLRRLRAAALGNRSLPRVEARPRRRSARAGTARCGRRSAGRCPRGGATPRGVSCLASHPRRDRGRVCGAARASPGADRPLPGAGAFARGRNPGRLGDRRDARCDAQTARHPGHRHGKRARCRCARIGPDRCRGDFRAGAARATAPARASDASWGARDR